MTFTMVELIGAARAGDQGAWAQLVSRYEGLLRARARSFGLQEADTLDAVQATWLRLHEHLADIREPERLAGWLSTTVSRECLRLIAHRQRHAGTFDFDVLTDHAADPEETVLEAERAREVRAAVAELPPGGRTVIGALFAREPLSYAQLAAHYGLAIGSVGPTRCRALVSLRRRLEPVP
jgi:RNA polymerase sigma factor (sigma-70 family)